MKGQLPLSPAGSRGRLLRAISGGGRAGGVFRNLLLAAVGNEGGKVPDSSGKEAQDAVSAVAALEDSYFRRCEESLRTAARERPGEAQPLISWCRLGGGT